MLSAVRVRVASVPAVLAILAATVMFPAPVPEALVVAMLTLVPAFRAVWIVVFWIVPAEPVATQGVPDVSMPDEALELMVMSAGSSSHSPPLPEAARALALARPRMFRLSLDEVSTIPPLPDFTPPWALIWPAKLVAWSDHSTTCPPSPFCVASAEITASAETCVVCACASAPRPCAPPPIWTTPPPVAPSAAIFAPSTLILAPVTVT